jgi:glucose-1-phosphate thymidylyltransferase
MLSDIREILIIGTPLDVPLYQRLLGDGSDLGLRIEYAEQHEPNGIAEAFIIGADFIGDDQVALVLGDNIFHGPTFSTMLTEQAAAVDGCVLFGYPVNDPHRYGVCVTDSLGRIAHIEEKPEHPRSNRAVTGLYFYHNDVIDVAKNLRPSPRGELEITDVNRHFVERGTARLVDLGRGFAWLDTGTPESLLQAGQYVRMMEERQGVRIGCIEEVATRMGFIDADACERLGARHHKSAYGQYVMEIAAELRGEGQIHLV